MGLNQALRNLDRLDEIVEPILRAAGVPGAAIAIVVGRETVLLRGYGYRDLEARLPMTTQTVYPIASTTKAINATLIGMLVDGGHLEWDVPVQEYLPTFRLRDPVASAQSTLRDLVTMRTGLPRHDWVWLEIPLTRAVLVERLRHLEPSAGFRQRLQYNNLSVTAAGHVAETVAAQPWEDLARERLLEPLGMLRTGFALPTSGEISLAYHQNDLGVLVPTPRYETSVTAPSGGSVHSTVEDMALWTAFNLTDGSVRGRRLIHSGTLAEIQSPWVLVGAAPEAISLHCAYGGGWFVDSYNGHARISHGGYMHDVNSDVSIYPESAVGIVSFSNFGSPRCSRLINEHIFDLMFGFNPAQSLADKLADNARKRADAHRRNAAWTRVIDTAPSHTLNAYPGIYWNRGHGEIQIIRKSDQLFLLRGKLTIALNHWHYDSWVARETDVSWLIPALSEQSTRLTFETDAAGAIGALSVPLEPAVAPIRFARQVVSELRAAD